jgi:hypothetical protein
MSLTTRVGLLAGASALTLTGASFADNPTSGQSTEARIAELEAQVAQLTGDNWMTEQRADEIRNVVQDVLADADTRASLLQSGMSAGYDDGFVIGSADGGFMMRINGQLQTRYVYNNVDTANPAGTDDTNRAGFENTRTKLIFSGTAGEHWSYMIEGDFARDGGTDTLEDAWVKYDMGDGWALGMGQFKVPVNREWLVNSADQLAVERSNVSYLNAAARTQGIVLSYVSDQWRMWASYNDGINGGVPGVTPGSSGANMPWSTYGTEFAFSGRADFLLAGNWDQFEDFTSPPGSEQGLMIGVGTHYQVQDFGTPTPNPKESVWLISADVSWEGDGFNVFANFNYSDLKHAPSNNPWGFVVQGGYYFNEMWEGFVRYEFNDFDTDLDDLSIITVGVNGYYSKNVKMTADVGFGLETANGTSNITGWQNELPGQDGEIVARAQLQLVF